MYTLYNSLTPFYNKGVKHHSIQKNKIICECEILKASHAYGVYIQYVVQCV